MFLGPESDLRWVSFQAPPCLKDVGLGLVYVIWPVANLSLPKKVCWYDEHEPAGVAAKLESDSANVYLFMSSALGYLIASFLLFWLVGTEGVRHPIESLKGYM